MGEPARKIQNDGEENRYLSARERANSAWGMDDQPETSLESEDDAPSNVSSMDEARKRKDNNGLTAPELKDQEASANEPKDTDAEKQEKEKASPDESGAWKTNVSRAKSNVITAKKLGIAGGIIGTLAIAVIALFSFLMPFKLTHIIESIEQRVGEVPQYAVERRVEYYMSRYLMVRALEDTGQFDFGPNGADRNRFTYLGNSFWDSMYTNWRGANLEQQMVSKHGKKLVANVRPEMFNQNYKPRASDFRVENLKVSPDHPQRFTELSRSDTRRFLRGFAVEATKTNQVFKRYNIRKVMKKYYGVDNWRPFEKLRDDTANRYNVKKRAFQMRLVNATVGRLSERYPLYMECLFEGRTSRQCRAELKRADPETNLPESAADEDGRSSVEDDVAQGADSRDSATNTRISRAIMNKVQEFGLKKILASLAGPAAIIEWLDTFSRLENSLSSGVLNQVIYDKNAQQYLSYAAPVLSAADQIRAGENSFDIEDAQVANEVFNNYTESLTYQAGTSSGSGTVSAQAGLYADCDNDDAGIKETLLEPGETVCPEKRLVQDKTAFTDNPGWNALHNVFEAYRAGWTDDILGFITGIVNGLADITGLDSVVASIADITGFDDFTAGMFARFMNIIAGPVASGAEVGGSAYDNLYAGIATQHAAVGGDVGVNKEDSIGGAYLSIEAVAAIRDEQMADYNYDLKNKSFLARTLSPSIKESVVGNFALNMPTDLPTSTHQVASFLSNPLKIFGSLRSVLFTKSGAQNIPTTNPFHVINMGFPVDHEIFTAHGDEGMDPDEINSRYRCDLPVNERPQNQAFGTPDNLPFEVPTEVDPCLLEQAALDASTRYFTGRFDEDIDAPGVAQTPPGTSTSSGRDVFVVGDSLTVGMQNNGLEDALRGAGFNVVGIQARQGATVSTSITTLNVSNAAALGRVNGAVVIALGTNDGGTEAFFAPRVQDMIDEIRRLNSGVRIVWVNAYGEGHTFPGVNNALTTQAPQLGFQVLDWRAEAQANPTRYPFAPDDIHHTSTGYQAKATWLAGSLSGVVQSAPPQSSPNTPTRGPF